MSMRPSAHPRLSWAVFGATCALGLAAVLVASSSSGGRTNLGVTFLGGVVVVGIAAALMYAIISPMPDGLGSPARSHGGWADGGSAGGLGDGGGSGGGFGGGGGGGDGC